MDWVLSIRIQARHRGWAELTAGNYARVLSYQSAVGDAALTPGRSRVRETEKEIGGRTNSGLFETPPPPLSSLG